jgi:prepilin-type N-terminal cleavage/methylation domain-containing protein/prepilin-type processing-associated H-X9-DG protein
MKRAFTLIELLVVIAIIGILAALLVPAVQSARSAARRVHCQNNLKQMGVALSNYLSARGMLPMSAVAGSGRGIHHSFLTMILPELEQRPLFQAYNFQLENFAPANATVVGTQVSTYLCPENPLPRQPVPSQQVWLADETSYPAGSAFARGHYAANWGGSQHSLGKDFATVKGLYRGVMMTVRAVGPRGPTKCVRSQDIPDGLATTVLVGEKRDSQGWGVGGYAGSEFDAGPTPAMGVDEPTVRTVFSGSYHSNLAHFLFCDGSVRGLRASMDKNLWYAVLTRDGKEVVSGDGL